MSASLAGPAFEDLTARARIREAALVLFAERGIEGATIRDIARAAGVSGGLVRHHFGSKDDLRDACDSYALDQLMGLKEQAVLQGRIADAGFMSAAQPALLVIFRYLARSMVDGSAVGCGDVRRDGRAGRAVAKRPQPRPGGRSAGLRGSARRHGDGHTLDARAALPRIRG